MIIEINCCYQMIKGCIFDLDGVVVNTAHYHFEAWQRIARELGFEFTEKHNERLKGVSRAASLDILLEVGGLVLPDAEKQLLAAKKNAWYLEHINKMSAADILPGTATFIDLVKSIGIKTALGTSSKNAPLILKQVGLLGAFDSIVDGNRAANAKPDPEVFLMAADDLKIDPQYCVVFEDAIAGVEAAHRGGMKCIGVGDPLTLAEADKVIPGFMGATIDLLNI